MNSPRVCIHVCTYVCMYVCVGCIVDVPSLHTSTQPARNVYYSFRPASRVLLSPVPCCPSCLSTSIPFDHTGDSPRAPRLASSHSLFPFLLSPCRNLSFPPRRPRLQFNERYTLSSSCSRRRCFHSAAQSVSARLPVRFVHREMRVRTYAGRTSVTHEPKRTWEEIRAFAR